MLKLKKIAVTGGLASGKTTVCRFLEECGAYVVSADSIVHQLLSPLTDVGKRVVALLGPEVVVDGKLSREKISEKVFQEISLLKRLERIIHPEVQKEIERLYQKISQTRHAFTLFVVEIPLLFESKMEKFYNFVLVVVTDEETCEKRFQKISNQTKQAFQERATRQMSMQEKAERADIVIENNGSLDELHSSVKRIYNQLCQ